MFYLKSLYAYIFSSNKSLIRINKIILNLALSALGYNNYRNSRETGEEFFIEKYLSKKKINLCFDIGANIGNYSKLLLSKTKSKVISFEPLPHVFNELKENLAAYSDRILFVNKGIGSKNETIAINYNNSSNSHASFSEEVNDISYLNNNEKLLVEVITIDDYCKENNIASIDFIKIDTEGFEKEVFEGAIKTFEKIKPKFIQIEFNWHQLFRNTSLLFFSRKLPDYEVYQLTYNNIRKVDVKDPFSNIYMFSNFVFIRKDLD